MSINLPADLLFFCLLGLAAFVAVYWSAFKWLKKRKPEIAKRIKERQFSLLVGFLVLVLISLLILPVVLIPIAPGQVGVMWHRFAGGTDTKAPFAEGTVLVWPWDRLIIYSSRYQTRDLKVESVSKEGLRVTLDIVVRYRPVRSRIPLLHKVVGEQYADILIMPEVGSSSRLIASKYTAEQIYTNKRQEMHSKIFDHVLNELKINQRKLFERESVDNVSELVALEDIMIRDVILPERVHTAIINKVNQSYLSQEYDTRLEVADKEAKRKETEAKGIKAFQETVSGGISETYLRWRGIEATIELAKSHNAKVVVIGGGKDGLPLILNTENSLSPVAATQNQDTSQTAQQQSTVDNNALTLPQGSISSQSIEVGQSSYDAERLGQSGANNKSSGANNQN